MAEPLSPLGSKVQAVWRYFDLGWAAEDVTKYNMDVVGINWSPVLSPPPADFFEEFEIRLSHSPFLPDDGLPNTAILGSPNFFSDNILDDGQEVVHPRGAGYTIDPIDLFLSANGSNLMPYPMNQGGGSLVTYTWRDTGITSLNGPNGAGIPTREEVTAGAAPAQGTVAGPDEVPSQGLPLLMEFRCYPSNTGLGLNLFNVALGVGGTATPLRVFSAGGVDNTGSSIQKNPDLEVVPSGGFNPITGLGTPDADGVFYLGQLDTVIRVSRAASIWIDTLQMSPDYVDAVTEPPLDVQPVGTDVVLDYRGAIAFTNADNRPFDADSLDIYGEITAASGGGTVTYLNGISDWDLDINAVDGAQYIQIRMTFVNNVDTGLSADLSGIGISYIN